MHQTPPPRHLLTLIYRVWLLRAQPRFKLTDSIALAPPTLALTFELLFSLNEMSRKGEKTTE